MDKKIMFFDIETSPLQAYVWRTGKQYVDYNQVVEGSEVKIICICWKYLGDPKSYGLHWNTKTQSDAAMLKKFTKEANKADIVMGHNIDRFDIGHIRTRIALNDIKKARWAEGLTADTLKQYRRSFNLPSNRLDAVARMLGIGHKNPMSFDDWVAVMNGSKKALTKMMLYCHKDVDLNIKVHKRLSPYIKITNHEKKLMDVQSESHSKCTECGSDQYIKYGTYNYKCKPFQRYLCRSCNTVFPKVKRRQG